MKQTMFSIVTLMMLLFSMTSTAQSNRISIIPNDTIFCATDTLNFSYVINDGSTEYTNFTGNWRTTVDSTVYVFSNKRNIGVTAQYIAEAIGTTGYIDIVLAVLAVTPDYTTIYDTITVYLVPYVTQDLCMVTVDTATGSNLVLWDKADKFAVNGWNIYKRNDATSQFALLDFVDRDSLSAYVDVTSNPPQISATYKIAAVDTSSHCALQFLSTSHTTVHLSANQGVNGEVNLQWSAYDGFSYSAYEIFRSNNGQPFTQIGSTANTILAYSDLTPPSGTNYYYIAVTNPNVCTPSRSVQSSISNILNSEGETVGIADVFANKKISVYPNPFTDKLAITPNTAYKLFDLVGREVYNSENKTNLSQLPVGTYILKTANGSTRVTKINE